LDKDQLVRNWQVSVLSKRVRLIGGAKLKVSLYDLGQMT
jgi:hypothetical protein